MTDMLIIACVGFMTGITTVLFGFGGGFVVVPFVYQLLLRQPILENNALHIAVATSTAVMVFNAGWASYKNYKAGKLSLSTLFPLFWFIAAGAILGSLISNFLSESLIRILFILYMIVTILDCIYSKNFFINTDKRQLSSLTTIGGGLTIGGIAALLGVGGSVMTVPLLRKHGYKMQECVSSANPLSFPVALCGTLAYTLSGWGKVPGDTFMGFINLKILLVLVTFGLIGIFVSQRYIPAINDKWHARIYVLLLILVLLSMVL